MSVREAYQISFSEEETEQWEDVEGEEPTEQPAWDFLDFRRRSSVLRGLLRVVNNRGSVAAGQRRELRQQPEAAMAAQIKFQSPPTFTGGKDEDVVQWMHRYERIGRYNRWGEDALRDHVKMSLSGAALKWYTYKEAAGQLANDWQGQAGPRLFPG